MKPKFANHQFAKTLVIAFTLAAGSSLSLVHAAPLYYDTTAANGLTPGTATWDANTTAAWQTSATPGTTAPGFWVSGETATFNVGPNTVTVDGTVNAGGLSVASGNSAATTIGGSGTIELTGSVLNSAGNQTFTLGSKINLLGDVTLTNSDAARSITINGGVSGSFGLIKASAGNDNGIVLLGGTNTYSGNTVINDGILRLTVNNATSPNSVMVVHNGTGSKLDLNGTSTTIAGLSNNAGTAGIVDNLLAATASILTINVASGTQTFSGQINSTTGSLALLKTGAGTQLLNRVTGNNSYSGGTTIDAGVLAVTGGNNIGGSGANVTINTNGTLGVSNMGQAFLDRVVTTSDGTIALGANDGDSLNFTGGRDNLYLGATGTFNFTASAANFTPGANGYLLGGGGGTLVMAATNMLTSTRNVTVRGNVTIANNQNYTGTTTVSTGTLLINGAQTAATGTITVKSTGLLGGNGSSGGAVVMESGGGLSARISDWTGSAGTGYFDLSVASLDAASVPMNLKIDTSGLVNFTESAASFTILNTTGGITNFNPANVTITAPGFTGTGTWSLAVVSNSLVLSYSSSGTSTYAGWASSVGVTGGVNGDSDNDGIPNGVEYGLNTNPNGSDGSPGTYSGNILSFNKRILTSGNTDLNYSIEVSTDLGISDSWDVLTSTQDPDSIEATVPSTGPKNFARLRVVVGP